MVDAHGRRAAVDPAHRMAAVDGALATDSRSPFGVLTADRAWRRLATRDGQRSVDRRVRIDVRRFGADDRSCGPVPQGRGRRLQRAHVLHGRRGQVQAAGHHARRRHGRSAASCSAAPATGTRPCSSVRRTTSRRRCTRPTTRTAPICSRPASRHDLGARGALRATEVREQHAHARPAGDRHGLQACQRRARQPQRRHLRRQAGQPHGADHLRGRAVRRSARVRRGVRRFAELLPRLDQQGQAAQLGGFRPRGRGHRRQELRLGHVDGWPAVRTDQGLLGAGLVPRGRTTSSASAISTPTT